MEKETYRLHLESLLRDFPDRPILAISAICKYLHKSRPKLMGDRAFAKLVKRNGTRIHMSRENLAYWMCGQ